ncbi:MAG: C-GCAxxG-C-C family protein [Desulfobacteraceae bacterium]|nr:C-GCAxxG-C-C family protein [Desulfobacteraceae bacterium]
MSKISLNMGAINSGKTICGVLFGASIYLGFLNGKDSANAPKLKDEGRLKAIKSVHELFNGFINQFGETDCTSLTGCDWGKKEDIKRYFKDEIYKDICFRQFEYVVEKCINEKAMANQ